MAATLATHLSPRLPQETLPLSIEEQQNQAVSFPKEFVKKVDNVMKRVQETFSKKELFTNLQFCRSVKMRSPCERQQKNQRCAYSHSLVERFAYGYYAYNYAYKTSLCVSLQKEFCRMGESCKYIHYGELGGSCMMERYQFFIRRFPIAPSSTANAPTNTSSARAQDQIDQPQKTTRPPSPSSTNTSMVEEGRHPRLPLPVEGFSFFSETYV